MTTGGSSLERSLIRGRPVRLVDNMEIRRAGESTGQMRELERQWESSLKDLHELEQQHVRFRHSHPITVRLMANAN